MRRARVVVLWLPLLLAAACGSKAPPAPVTPATSGLAVAPAATPVRKQSPWQGSRFFGPKKPAPAPLFSKPRRPIRGPAVHTLHS